MILETFERMDQGNVSPCHEGPHPIVTAVLVPPEELQAQGMLALKRGYWVVESRLHHCLDISMQEDQSRVRTPRAARVLGTIRRVVLSLANAAVDKARKKNPKTKANTKSFQQRFRSARGGRERLRALIFAKSPNVLPL